jgi:hypothetical protein
MVPYPPEADKSIINMKENSKNKIVLAFLPNTLANSFIIILDEVQKQLYKGEKVVLIGCEGTINNCELNPCGSKFICTACSHCLRESIKFLNGNFDYYSAKSFIDQKDIKYSHAFLETITGIQDFKRLKYKGFEVGYAVSATYISLTRNHNPVFDSTFIMFIKKLYNDSIDIFNSTEAVMDRFHIKKIIIYNGRLHTSRPVLSLAQKNDIPIDVMEVVGGYGGKLIEKVVFENTLPHDIMYNKKLIYQNWSLFQGEKNSSARSFFEDRRAGLEAGDRAYVKNQTLARLPEGFNKKKQNISIFISSDDEMAAIGKEWEWDFLGGTQLNATKRILELFNDNINFHFYIRVHPNLKKVKFKYHTDYLFLEKKFNNVTVISASSKVSTYALLEKSDKIISFGSTVGAEAVYWSKPSILIGKAMYMGLNITYNPSTEEELVGLIVNTKLAPKPVEGALKYGLYLYKRKSEKLKYFDSNNHRKKPRWLNQNLYLYNLDPNNQFNVSSLVNFILFSTSRIINNFILRNKIPIKEK